MQALEAEKQALHKSHQDAELVASELRLRQAGLQKEVLRQRLALTEGKQQLRWVDIALLLPKRIKKLTFVSDLHCLRVLPLTWAGEQPVACWHSYRASCPCM